MAAPIAISASASGLAPVRAWQLVPRRRLKNGGGNVSAVGREVVRFERHARAHSLRHPLLRALLESPLELCSRPRQITDVAHQEEVINTLKSALETANVR